MKYITIEQAQEPISLWSSFADAEKVYWYNPVRQQTIFAAVRAAAFGVETFDDTASTHSSEYPYLWYSETFFPNTKSDLWAGMGNEVVGFNYYYVQDEAGARWFVPEHNDEVRLKVEGLAKSSGASCALRVSAGAKESHVTKTFEVSKEFGGTNTSGGSNTFEGAKTFEETNEFGVKANRDNSLTLEEATDSLASMHQAYTISTDDYEDWHTFFSVIQDTIQSGKAVKIVASRAVKLESEVSFDIDLMLRGLQRNNPSSFVFAYAKGDAVFIGATPEILVQKNQSHVLSYALAGTIKKQSPTDRAAGQALLEDPKNCHEHAIVVDMIKSTMKTLSSRVEAEEMGLMELKNLFHLRTIITAEGGAPNILTWAHALHPTPAMGGQPREVALDVLAKAEPQERGLYAAPLGFLETNGNGHLDGTIVVGIRSALVKDNIAYAYAGCGIVGDSDCLSEYEETKTKLGTILEVL
ncbi:isochorismate synthase MenF [uncultured Veillonella sp.]|uniref:isochorismate synthase n=1 Tax=uncultured Veillonella sp. TaxID=159268 RepID=UPI002628C1EE|nr:isochorismate synthase [uncultured Veillonella sp.]